MLKPERSTTPKRLKNQKKRTRRLPPNGICYPWSRWDGGLADFRRYSGGGACAFWGFGTFWGLGRFGVVDLSGFNTEILRVHRHPTSSQKAYEFTDILRVHRKPTSSQKSYEFKEILRVHRNPTSSQKFYEFTEIQRVHRNPTSSQTSYEFTEILRVHRHPTSSEDS